MANSPKRAAASTQVMVKLQQTSRLVGKGGSIVNQMQEESGARINISRNEEAGWKPVELKGTLNVRIAAVGAILQRLFPPDGTEGQASLSLMLPPGTSSKVIGKGGSRVKEIQESTESKVELAKNGGGFCTVTAGTAEQTANGVAAVLQTIEPEGDQGEDGEYPAETESLADLPWCMLVEHKMVPLIIGSKGDTIQQITSESGAVIDVGKRSEPGGGDNKVVTLKGDPSQKSLAMQRILERLQNSALADEAAVVRVLVPSQNASRVVGTKGANVKRLSEDHGTKIDVGREDVGGWRVVTVSGDVGQAVQAAGQIYSMANGRAESRGSLPVVQDPRSYPSVNYAQARVMQQPAAMGTFAPAPAPGPVVGGGSPGGPWEMLLSNTAVPLVIGPKGSNVQRIQQSSGAHVTAGRDPVQESPDDRLISIDGPTEGRTIALQMILDQISGGQPQVSASLLAPQGSAPMIVGPKGATVRRITQSTGTTVDVDKQPLGAWSCVRVVGSSANIARAAAEIYAAAREGGGGTQYAQPMVMQAVQPVVHAQPQFPAVVQPPMAPAQSFGRQSASEDDGLKVLLPDRLAAGLVGTRGANIKALEQHSGSRIDVPKAADGWGSEKPVTVRGSADQKRAGMEAILRQLANELVGPDGQLKAKLLVPAAMGPMIVGTRGATIKELCAQSRTKIDVEKHDSVQGWRAVQIEGALESVLHAASLIDDLSNRNSNR